jgi:7-keto-8-aminopelargonate synthetase-like enzyme
MQIQSNKSTTVVIGGREYLYFGGTNYLGLAHRAELLEAATRAFRTYGFSAGASRLTSGENDLLLALERDVAGFAGAEQALVLPTGFITNAAVVDAIDAEVDYWISSKRAHGSISCALAQSKKPVIISDFSIASNATTFRARHELPGNCKLGVFAEPIDPLLGTVLDLPSLFSALSADDFLILDEAHSFGVLGSRGAGAVEALGVVSSDRLIRTGTFSKALGASGGFILSSGAVIDSIKKQSAYFRLSTPLSPVVCAASIEALRLLKEDGDSTIAKLKTNIARVNNGLVKLGFAEFAENPLPIFHLSNSEQLGRLRSALPDMGVYIPAVTTYFSDSAQAGLRWTIQAGHTNEQLDMLLKALSDYCG